jgi:RNA polymerase sigma-70 factor, ECF subfamily
MTHPMDMVAANDALALARAGSQRGLERLWTLYQPMLLRYLRGRGHRHADDIASTVWIDVGRGLARFVGDADDFRRWLYTIAHRRAVDNVRASVRRADAEHRHSIQPAAHASMSDPLDDALALVNCLPSDMAEAVLLRIVADMSVSDVALVMNKTEGNVRILTHRGLERLRLLVAQSHETSNAV